MNLEANDDLAVASCLTTTPAATSPWELAEAVERVARSTRSRLTPGQMEVLMLAARRLRQLAGQGVDATIPR